MTRKGFTLIEILIVVAIIAILAGAVLVGFGPAQRQGRDARRVQDLQRVQGALELYYNKCGHYPGDSSCGRVAVANWAGLSTVITGSSLGINQALPNDPSSGATYSYGADGNFASYVLGAALEDANNPALNQSYKTSEYGVTCSGSNYCIKF